VLSISTIEKKGFDVVLENDHVLIKLGRCSSNTTTILRVRERKLHRLKGQPMQAMERNRVIEDKEQVTLKVGQLRGSQPSGLSGKEQPYKYFNKESWHEMKIHDSQE
jgi:hypothetical protein